MQRNVSATPDDLPVVIVGGGIAGLACARRLHEVGIAARVLEARNGVGGRIKTDSRDGFLLDHGFQVLQTAYPEAQRVLDFERLKLRHFAPGAMIRIRGHFYTLADPRRRPSHWLDTLTAPVGGLGDRLRLLRLVRRVTRGELEDLFQQPESGAIDYLKAEGFSHAMIEHFFRPFFGGVCLDKQMRASSRVLQYVLRMFAEGEAAIPTGGMGQIPQQLAAGLPAGCVTTDARVGHIRGDMVFMEDGSRIRARAVVVATEGPEAARLLGSEPPQGAFSETCLYFSCDRAAWHTPYLVLNGEGSGVINNIAFPSRVSPAYAPAGKSLASVVVLGDPDDGAATLAQRVQDQLADWFGEEVRQWRHLKSYRIAHALPDQSPPSPNPTAVGSNTRHRSGIFVCGEYESLPGIQWALLSARRTADAVRSYLRGDPASG